jgi:hypothetical protein
MSKPEILTHSTFAELKDKNFRIYHNSDEPVEVKLIEVGDLVETKRQEIFSILFTIPENVKAEQASYKMEHDQLGTIELFLVPVMNGESTAYEAVFNNLKKKKE